MFVGVVEIMKRECIKEGKAEGARMCAECSTAMLCMQVLQGTALPHTHMRVVLLAKVTVTLQPVSAVAAQAAYITTTCAQLPQNGKNTLWCCEHCDWNITMPVCVSVCECTCTFHQQLLYRQGSR